MKSTFVMNDSVFKYFDYIDNYFVGKYDWFNSIKREQF